MRFIKRFVQLLLPLLLLAGAGCALVLWLAAAQRDKQDEMLSSMGFLGDVTGFSVTAGEGGDFPTQPGLSEKELKAQLDKMVEFASSTDFNTIFLQVRPDGTVLYKSKYFDPHPSLSGAKTALGSFDPLEYLCKAAMAKQVQVYAMADLLSAPKELTRAAMDAGARVMGGKLDLSQEDTREFLALSTAELAKKYQIAGVLLDGVEGADPQELSDTLSRIRSRMGREASGAGLALIFDGREGSSITPDFIRGLTEDGLLDLVFPRLTAPVEAPSGEEDYAAQLARWSDAVAGSAKLLSANQVGLLTQEGQGGYSDPEELNYQLLLGSMAPKVSGALLEHYGILSKDLAETEMLISFLATPKNPLPNLSFTIPRTLSITYPQANASVTDSAVFLMGTSDPEEPLYLDGTELQRISTGGTWGAQVKLAMGNNTFTLRQGETTQTITVRRYTPGVSIIKGITESSLFPRYPYGVDSNEELTLSCIGPAGGRITATLGGRTIELSPVSAASQGTPVAYRGVLTLRPDDYSPNNTASIGKVTYHLTYGGVTTTYESQGEVYVAGKNVRLAVENIAQLSAVLTDPDDDESIVGTLKPGARAYVEKVVRTSRSGVITLAYQIQGGGYILAGTPSLGTMVQVLEGAPGISMELRDISTDLGEDGSLTLTLGEGTPAVVTRRTQDQLVLDCYDTSVTGELTQFTNGFIRSASASELPGGVRLTLKLEPDGGLWGHDVFYQDGKTMLYLKPSPVRSSTFGKPLEGVRVLLDAGHGGSDPGAMGVAGTSGPTEAQLNLALTYAVKYRLEQLGASVSLTRVDDSKVSLMERVDAATELRPDFFLSIHHNSGVLTGNMNLARRMECYYFEDISQPFAVSLMDRLPPLLDRPGTEAEQARYYVTRQTANPAVLLEVGFMVNPLEYEECTDSIKIFKTACGVAQSMLDLLPAPSAAPAQGTPEESSAPSPSGKVIAQGKAVS